MAKLTQEAVDTALEKWLGDTAAAGRPSIDISVGALHARVGATKEPPMCCDAMWKLYDKSIDTLLSGDLTRQWRGFDAAATMLWRRSGFCCLGFGGWRSWSRP